MKRAIIAFGGNALIKAKEFGIQAQQVENAKEAAEMIVSLMGKGMLPVIVHGNGPQVGNVLLQQEEAANRVPPYTMDLCGAQTQGSIGYLLQRCLENMLRLKSYPHQVAVLLTEVVVDPKDPGFQHPTKPVGPFYESFRAQELEMQKGWTIKEDAGRGWRRLVPSPRPQRLVQIDAIRALVDRGFVVLAGGGGGIPVIEDANGYFLGVEAVIDKDLTAALLARQIGAEVFIILTGVEKVFLNFGKDTQKALDVLTAGEARKYLDEGQFPPGSMGPKIRAAIDYIEGGGSEVLITTAEALLRQPWDRVGTRIVSNPRN